MDTKQLPAAPAILAADGRPIRPQQVDPHQVIFAGGLNAVHLFNALGDRAAALTQQAHAMHADMQIMQWLVCAMAGLAGGEVVLTAELEAAVRESAAMIGVVKREDGSWHLFLTRPHGAQPDPAVDTPLDLGGHLVACRAAAKPLQQAREAKAS